MVQLMLFSLGLVSSPSCASPISSLCVLASPTRRSALIISHTLPCNAATLRPSAKMRPVATAWSPPGGAAAVGGFTTSGTRRVRSSQRSAGDQAGEGALKELANRSMSHGNARSGWAELFRHRAEARARLAKACVPLSRRSCAASPAVKRLPVVCPSTSMTEVKASMLLCLGSMRCSMPMIISTDRSAKDSRTRSLQTGSPAAHRTMDRHAPS